MRIKIWLAMMIVTFMTLTTVAKIVSRPLPEPSVFTGSTRFETRNAMLMLNDLANSFPKRDYTNDQRLLAADWIKRQLAGMGLQVFTQDYSEVIAGKKVTGLRNVYAVLPGADPNAILVVAHFDTPPFVRQGAADDASGVATLLELARVFSKEKPQRTMIFLASGSETYGAMWGSVKFLRESGWSERLSAVLTLDHANLGAMKGIRLKYAGTQQGYTPLWYRELALQSVGQETHAIDSDLLTEWLERSALIAPEEPGVYLRAGIPAVNMVGIPRRISWQKQLLLTKADTTDRVWAGSIGKYGRAAERTLRSLLTMGEFPKGESTYWKTGDRFIPGHGIILLQLLFLIPLIVGLIEAWRNMEGIGANGLGKEFSQWLAIIIAGAAGYFALWLSAGYGLIKLFELHPAAMKDPILLHPAWLPLLLAVGTTGLAYYAVRIAFQIQTGRSPVVGFALFMTILTLLLIIGILNGAGFACVTFLGPAVLLWPLIKPSKALSRRIINTLLSMSLPILVIYVLGSLAHMFDIVNFWWYLIMATVTGLISIPTLLFYLASFALFLRVIIITSTQPTTYRADNRISSGNRTMRF